MNFDKMMSAKCLVNKLQQSLSADNVSDELLFTIFNPTDEVPDSSCSHDDMIDDADDFPDCNISLDSPLDIKSICIKTLKALSKMWLPCEDKHVKLIFCTASSSFELFRLQSVRPISILVAMRVFVDILLVGILVVCLMAPTFLIRLKENFLLPSNPMEC